MKTTFTKFTKQITQKDLQMQCKPRIQNRTDKFREGRSNVLKNKYIFAYRTCTLKNIGWGMASWPALP